MVFYFRANKPVQTPSLVRKLVGLGHELRRIDTDSGEVWADLGVTFTDEAFRLPEVDFAVEGETYDRQC